MDGKKVAKKTAGVVLISAGVATELAKFGLHAADVVLSGARNLANHFVKGPDLGISKTIASDVQKGLGKVAGLLKSKGKELMR